MKIVLRMSCYLGTSVIIAFNVQPEWSINEPLKNQQFSLCFSFVSILIQFLRLSNPSIVHFKLMF